MKKLTVGASAVLAGLLMLFALPAAARGDDPTSGEIVLFPGNGLAPLGEVASENMSVPQGWNIPGRSFRAGDGWWALVCESSCVLKPQRLNVRSGTHPDYDGPPLPSQLLSWSEVGGDDSAPDTTRPIMLFKPIRSAAAMKLEAGPVTTWLHAGMGRYPGSNLAGNMETVIDLGGAEQALLLPRLMLTKKTAESTREVNPADQTLVFELRAYGKRQRLDVYQWDIEGAHPLTGPEYLWWAGDLDGDGKLDLLMSYANRGWNAVLYLSTRAGPDEIVGEAGRFQFWQPDDPGC